MKTNYYDIWVIRFNEKSYQLSLEFAEGGLTKKRAKERAGKFTDEDDDIKAVFVSTFNGQCIVYLNADGNHSPVGLSWKL